MRACVRAFVRLCVLVCLRACVRACARARVHTCMCVCVRKRMFVRARVRALRANFALARAIMGGAGGRADIHCGRVCTARGAGARVTSRRVVFGAIAGKEEAFFGSEPKPTRMLPSRGRATRTAGGRGWHTGPGRWGQRAARCCSICCRKHDLYHLRQASNNPAIHSARRPAGPICPAARNTTCWSAPGPDNSTRSGPR